METVFAADLGLIEGLRSMSEKLVGIDILGLGVAGNARACRELKGHIADQDRLGGGFQKLFDSRQATLGTVEVAEHGNEFIAAKPRERVLVLHGGLHAVRNSGEEFVSYGVAVAVIDAFEVVEIKTDDCQGAATALGLGHGVAQAFTKVHSIGQTGEQIVQGRALHFLLVFLGR